MSINNDNESETIDSEFSKLNLVTNDHDNCYHIFYTRIFQAVDNNYHDRWLLNLVTNDHDNCYQPPEKFWCKKCVPSCLIEGWTSGNSEIDHFIKDTIYNAKEYYYVNGNKYPLFLEWVTFDRF